MKTERNPMKRVLVRYRMRTVIQRGKCLIEALPEDEDVLSSREARRLEAVGMVDVLGDPLEREPLT